MKKLLIAALVLGVLGLVGSSASAQTSATANLTVTARVAAACTLTTSGLAFGDYNPVAADPLMGTGSIVATCTKGTGSRIDIGSGLNSPSVNSRKMAGPLGTLDYQLYSDSSRMVTWGDNTGALGLTIPMAPDSTPRTFTVYGKIPAGQDAFAGSYTDTVLVTFNF